MYLNRQKIVAFLLAGSILAATIGLTLAEASAGQVQPGAGLAKADAVGYDSGLSPEFHLNAVKGGRPTGGGGGDVHK